jgi:hypothetical protein
MVNSQIKRGYEGYSKFITMEFDGEHHMQLSTGLPSKDVFTFRYAITEDKKQICQTSITLTNSEALDLQEIMEREQENRNLRSETFYNETVYMTCIAGGSPIISFVEKGLSVTLQNDEDYDFLLKIVKEYNENQQAAKLQPP